MLCPKCGAESAPGQKFCSNCGTPLIQQEPVQVAQQPASQQPTQQINTPESVSPAQQPVQQPVQQPAQQPVQPQPVQQSVQQPVQQPVQQGAPQQAYDTQPVPGQPYAGQPYAGQPYNPQNVPPVYNQPPAKKSRAGLIVGIILGVLALIIIAGIVIVKAAAKKATDLLSNTADELELDIDTDDGPLSIDLPGNEIEENIDEYEFDQEYDDYYDDSDDYEYSYDDLFEDYDSDTYDMTDDAGLTTTRNYAYADVTYTDTTVTIVPNGTVTGSTVLGEGKDLEGLLDYIDDEVLESGRYINRDFFYDLVSMYIVDPEMYDGIYQMGYYLSLALAAANNFHNIDVRLESSEFDFDNTDLYRLNVIAEGRKDTWIIDHSDYSFKMNNGKTSYESDMYDTKYLSVWLAALEEYYGIEF